MTDLMSGDITLDRFRGVVFPGGFSYAGELSDWRQLDRPIGDRFESGSEWSEARRDRWCAYQSDATAPVCRINDFVSKQKTS